MINCPCSNPLTSPVKGSTLNHPDLANQSKDKGEDELQKTLVVTGSNMTPAINGHIRRAIVSPRGWRETCILNVTYVNTRNLVEMLLALYVYAQRTRPVLNILQCKSNYQPALPESYLLQAVAVRH